MKPLEAFSKIIYFKFDCARNNTTSSITLLSVACTNVKQKKCGKAKGKGLKQALDRQSRFFSTHFFSENIHIHRRFIKNVPQSCYQQYIIRH